MKIGLRFWMVVCCASCIALPLLAEEDEVPQQDKIVRNTLFALGQRQIQAGEINEAMATLQRILKNFPEDAHVYSQLGYIYLKRKEYKEAEGAFKTAKKFDKSLVEAYVGLGLTYAETPTRGLQSYYNFRRAIREAKRATKLDPNYGPAYRLLGEVYERFEEDHTRAMQYYQKYVELEPDNPENLYSYGLACVQAKEFDTILEHIAPYLSANPDIVQLLPIVAQGHFYNDEAQKALELFERYLANIEGSERAHYTDIAYVASDTELQEYHAATPGPEQQAYREQFWARRDPDILTKLNERVIEHYRRTWYARTYYSSNVYPWDERGAVYIRYGEPDYRSRSNDRNFVQTAEVERVRTQMAVDIYGPEAATYTFTGPVFPIRTSLDISFDLVEGNPFERNPLERDGTIESVLNEQGKLNTRLKFGRFSPVTIDSEIDTVPWETWTYIQLNGGIEITFTDEMGNGRYDFAPLPDATGIADPEAIAYLARMTEHMPAVIYQQAVSTSPDFYRPGLPGDILNFYYDLAHFRGPDGQTNLEIYYGIPPEQVEIEQEADSSFIHVQLAVALANEGHTSIYRTTDEFAYRGAQVPSTTEQGAFVPEIIKTQVPPGKYELQVQMKDLISGRTGLYRQELQVRDYQIPELQVSEIQLASNIAEEGATKFLKEDVWIIPMPTRSYAATQNVYAYFEIYNLTKDTFGQTRYKTEYRIRSSAMPAVGVFGAVATGLRTIFRASKPQVAITNELTGRDADEREYVEIVLNKIRPGVNALEVIVTDLISGKSIEREVRFRYGN
ncbi:MAG: tetratricopeptide repeat protein [Gemmatimonadetes bacterium]|nr:tetratricopeptide repeat protein [Gemmatimonadota bacterium]